MLTLYLNNSSIVVELPDKAIDVDGDNDLDQNDMTCLTIKRNSQ